MLRCCGMYTILRCCLCRDIHCLLLKSVVADSVLLPLCWRFTSASRRWSFHGPAVDHGETLKTQIVTCTCTALLSFRSPYRCRWRFNIAVNCSRYHLSYSMFGCWTDCGRNGSCNFRMFTSLVANPLILFGMNFCDRVKGLLRCRTIPIETCLRTYRGTICMGNRKFFSTFAIILVDSIASLPLFPFGCLLATFGNVSRFYFDGK